MAVHRVPVGHTLVIVESPTKARTIRGFLPKDFKVEASMGHVRDLPNNASEIPAAHKGEKWANLGVNTAANFEPLYVVSKDKKKVVKELKDALKGADQLLLATDEDREGESISWHLLQLLSPKVPVKRNDGNWQGQILGTRAGTNASLKAFSLFGDEDDEDDAEATIRQEFGTMTSDVLTGLPDEDSEGVRESYGFGGDDLLIDLGTDGHLSLFGGDGLDRFRLSGEGEVWIRDLQAGELIELHRDVFEKRQSLSDVAFVASDQGPGFTDLTLGQSVLARLDGQWSSAQVNLGIWA